MLRRRYIVFALIPATLLLFILTTGTAPEAPAARGSISGTITYDDKVPNLKPLRMKADPECAALHNTPPPNQSLVLGDGNTLANVFVHISNVTGGNHPTPSKPVVIDQNGCLYTPRVVGVMAGQPLQFKNSDGILHNVHGLPKENREFNIGMPPTVQAQTITLNKPEPLFKVKCDVHPWQDSYVAVMTHPYFAVTGADGRFRIEDLPQGTYEIEAWHEKLGVRTATITIRGNADANVNFVFKGPDKR